MKQAKQKQNKKSFLSSHISYKWMGGVVFVVHSNRLSTCKPVTTVEGCFEELSVGAFSINISFVYISCAFTHK